MSFDVGEDSKRNRSWEAKEDEIEILKNIISLLCKLISESLIKDKKKKSKKFNESRGEYLQMIAAWDVQ